PSGIGFRHPQARTRRCPFPAGKGHPDVPALLQPAGGQAYKCPLIALAMAVIAATDRGWPLMAKWQARFPRWSQYLPAAMPGLSSTYSFFRGLNFACQAGAPEKK